MSSIAVEQEMFGIGEGDWLQGELFYFQNIYETCLQLAMLKCHMRLQELYNQLSDDESEDVASKAVTALTQELELFCNFCGQRFGIRDEALQALPCSHLFHQRFIAKLYIQ